MPLLDKYQLTKTVVVGNQIMSSEYYTQPELELTANQKKLLIYLISKIEKDDTELKYETIAMRDYCELFNINWDGGRNKTLLRKSVLALCKKVFVLPVAPGVERMFRWIGDFELDFNTNTLKIKLDDSLKPYYLGLKRNFAIYQIGYTIDFGSRYSYTLYEFLKSRANLKKFYISVEDAKMQFAYGKYPNFNNFKVNVLDIAVREINEKTDLNVKYRAIKKGRSYDQIIFTVAKKTGAALEKVDKWKTKIPTKHEEMKLLMDDFEEQLRFDNFDDISVDFEEIE